MTDLAALRAQWKETVDNSAESARQKYITRGYGQMLVYETKRREAAHVLLLVAVPVTPQQSDCPHLWAEADGLGLGLIDLATAVMAQANAWLSVSPQIEVLRLSAKAAIDEAETEAEIVAAATAAMSAWP